MIKNLHFVRICLAQAVLLSLTMVVNAQPFTSVSNPFPGLGRGALAFADLDNDGDLDLVMTGQDNTYATVGKIFENVEGVFSETASGFQGLYNSAMAVADYDHDGFQDVVITGQGITGNKTYLYRNNGNMQLVIADSLMYEAGADGDVAFGDYNNDGFADIALSGNWRSALYRNNGNGTFSLVPDAGLPDLNSTSIGWGDYDNDGDKDLLMVGDDGSVVAFIMQNNNGSFMRIDLLGVDGAIGGSARFGDHNLDGYLDIMITGKDYSLTPVSYIYRNNADRTFSNAFAGFVGTALGPADWIDYDNNGAPDVMLSGQNAGCGNASTRLYNNNGIGDYEEYPAGLAFVERASSTWGDFDNDGDFDLLLAGISVSATRMLYRNDLLNHSFVTNTPPTIPIISTPSVWENIAVLNWELSSDMQTPASGLSYNVRVGTTPGGIEIVAPEADPASGKLFMPSSGNAAGKNYFILTGLQPGTYYYSVQAVDQAYFGSGFSEEQSFIILPTNTIFNHRAEELLQVHREGGNLLVSISDDDNPESKYSGSLIQLFNSMGVLVKSTGFEAGRAVINVSSLPSGIYILKAENHSIPAQGKIHILNH